MPFLVKFQNNVKQSFKTWATFPVEIANILQYIAMSLVSDIWVALSQFKNGVVNIQIHFANTFKNELTKRLKE